MLNSPNGPRSFSFKGLMSGPGLLSLVLCPFKGLPPTEIRRRPVLRFPRPQDEASIFFRMQWNTSLISCDGFSRRCHTCTRVWQCEGSNSPARESTVISRYGPRLRSVSPGLLSMIMLPIVTAFRSTSLGLLLHWRCHSMTL